MANQMTPEMKAQAAEALKLLTFENVQSVYSGKPGCACGCRGNHRYNSLHAATVTRGYEVTPDEVNDRQVRKVLALVQANVDSLEAWEPGDNNFAVTLTNEYSDSKRLYIVYLPEAR